MESSCKNNEKTLGSIIDDRIDVIATDHTSYTLEEKETTIYLKLLGGPLVQHAVVAMFEAFHQGKISVEKIVEKCAIIQQDFQNRKSWFY
jgi:dihydroorotase